MEATLEVKNFGPITDATLKLRKVTVLIGPTGRGKSTLAKLIGIYLTGDYFTSSKYLSAEGVAKILSDFGLDDYARPEFESNYYDGRITKNINSSKVTTIFSRPEDHQNLSQLTEQRLRGCLS